MRAARLSVLLLLTPLLSPPVAAQVTVGASGMANMSDLSGDAPDRISYAGKTRFGLGLIGEVHLTDDLWLSIQPRFQPGTAGVVLTPEDEEDPVELFELQLDYFSIPVLAKFVTAGGKVYVVSGVNISFLTSAEAVPSDGNGEARDLKSSFEDTDISVDFGVGGQLPLGSIRIMLEARYEQGLSNIASGTIEDEALDSRLRWSGLQLIAGVLLPLGGER